MTKFDGIQEMLGLSEKKKKGQILSINMNNDPNRLYKRFGLVLVVYNQQSMRQRSPKMEEYLTYTTEELEKVG